MLIYINPGHGLNVHGKPDPGAVSPRTGMTEHKIVFTGDGTGITERIGNRIRARGIDTNDIRAESLRDAWKNANKQSADVLVSVHCNAAKNQSARGFEVLYAPLSTKGKQLASLICEEFVQDIKYLDSVWLRNPDLPQELYAEIPYRGLKAANLEVLRRSDMPGVLVEAGFLSNAEDEKLLMNRFYRQALAEAISRAVQRFIG